MIHADERSCFRHAVTLHDGIANPAPELFRVRWQRRAARNHCPEFPPKRAVNRAEAQPAAQEFFSFAPFVIALEFFEAALRGDIPNQLVAQRFNQPRHSDEHGNALLANGANYLRWIERVHEHRSPAENLRKKYSQQLPEDVAQRKQIQKTQWVKKAFVAPVTVDLLFNWLEIREKVSVRQHHSARLRRCSRCEDNFNGIVAPHRDGLRSLLR